MISSLPGKIKSAVYFENGDKVNYKETDYGILLHIPKEKQDSINTILVLEMQ